VGEQAVVEFADRHGAATARKNDGIAGIALGK
jgi:hypothetical protein